MNNFFRNIFRKKQNTQPETLTQVQVVEGEVEVEAVVPAPVLYHPRQMLVGTAQSVGRQRDHNEDALFALSMVLFEGESEYPVGVFVIADGMGGHQHGELASGATARVMGKHLTGKLLLPMLSVDAEPRSESLQEVMQEGVEMVQNAVLQKVPGGGTTLTAALVIGEQVTIAHVGDSRAYFITADGNVQVVTHDHSLVQRLVDLEQITEEDAQIHPQRNVLYRAIGQTEPFQADIETRPVPSPGYLLICSDGLWGLIERDELAKIILEASDPSEACHQLVQTANDAGGPDNITAILVEFK